MYWQRASACKNAQHPKRCTPVPITKSIITRREAVGNIVHVACATGLEQTVRQLLLVFHSSLPSRSIQASVLMLMLSLRVSFEEQPRLYKEQFLFEIPPNVPYSCRNEEISTFDDTMV